MPSEATEVELGTCDACEHKDHLTPLGNHDLCPRCFKEAIGDMELLNRVRESEASWQQ